MIDWQSGESSVLLNPRLPQGDAAELQSWLVVAKGLQRHVFLLTSGSNARSLQEFKWVALSKKAILAGAEASNAHLESDARDVWFHCLPEFHIAGVSIWARAKLSGGSVHRARCADRWDASSFVSEATSCRASLCSLVPTQIYDLVDMKLKAPASFRAILVGGGVLSHALYTRARDLGWPILPTYGMTEASSQVATADLGSLAMFDFPQLKILSHLDAKISDATSQLLIRGTSLLTAYIQLTEEGPSLIDSQSHDGWFQTEDLAEIEGRYLKIIGRVQDRIKIGGELSNLSRLRKIFEHEAGGFRSSMVLIAAPDPRLESEIHLVAESAMSKDNVHEIANRYNMRVLPFEKIRRIHYIETLPRSELGKVKSGAVLTHVQKQRRL